MALVGTSNFIKSLLIRPHKSVAFNQFLFSRLKSSKGSKKSVDEDEVNEKWDEANLDSTYSDVGSDYKDITTHVPSSRMDKILKVGLGLSNSKIETAFYDSKLRLNGEKVLKKSTTINTGDEVDFIIGINGKSDKFLDVMRVILRGIKSDSANEKVFVKLRRFKLLTIENYLPPNNYKFSNKDS